MLWILKPKLNEMDFTWSWANFKKIMDFKQHLGRTLTLWKCVIYRGKCQKVEFLCKPLYDVHQTRLLLEKKCPMIYLILTPKAQEGWIRLDKCQVYIMWLELTYYIETLATILNQGKSEVLPCSYYFKSICSIFFS